MYAAVCLLLSFHLPLRWLVGGLAIGALVSALAAWLLVSYEGFRRRDYAPLALLICGIAILVQRSGVSVCRYDDIYHCDKLALLFLGGDLALLKNAINIWAGFHFGGVETLWAALMMGLPFETMVPVSQVLAAAGAFFGVRYAIRVLAVGPRPSLEWMTLGSLLALQHVWGAVGSTFVDSLYACVQIATFAPLLAHLMKPKTPVPNWLPVSLTGAGAFLLNSKVMAAPWGGIAFLSAFFLIGSSGISRKRALVAGCLAIALSGAVMLGRHLQIAYVHSANPLYPVEMPVLKKLSQAFPQFIAAPKPIEQLPFDFMKTARDKWEAHPIFRDIEDPRIRVIANWPVDYKFRHPGPDSWVGAMGPVWPFVLMPAFLAGLGLALRRRLALPGPVSRNYRSWFATGLWFTIVAATVVQFTLFYSAYYNRYMIAQNFWLMMIGVFFLGSRIKQRRSLMTVTALIFALGGVQFLYSLSNPWYRWGEDARSLKSISAYYTAVLAGSQPPAYPYK